MRHRKRGRQLSRNSSHRKAVLRNLAGSLFLVEPAEGATERIVTTPAKAKEVRPLVEKVITLGKQGTQHALRQAIALLDNKDAVIKVFDEIAGRYETRPGGYTRMIHLARARVGDGAEQVILELVEGGEVVSTPAAGKQRDTAPAQPAAEDTTEEAVDEAVDEEEAVEEEAGDDAAAGDDEEEKEKDQ